ncbi:circadian clock-controlled protein daywake-like [Spodoptera frugiperda]|uniref:Circadian clock-controlled protein daywake-like n=1 Tax=Spodoptera frugiperda TaxID=7108 RepID=A0A9R0F787_SPOFR|nr:circadian clock-controlled protein daywake-like [Spodoptera frugiperda]
MVPLLLLFASVAGLIDYSYAASAAFVIPCRAADEKCLLDNLGRGIEAYKDGIPELGVGKMDPLYFTEVDSSSPNLKFILRDLTVTGLKSCKPLKLKRDPAKSTIVLKLQCPIKLDGEYELDGQVLVLKVGGKGKIHVFLKNLEIEVTLDIVKKEKNGEEYMKVKKFTHSYELKEKSDLVFEGLFQENKVLSEAANDLIKNSPNEIVNEIGGKMFEACITEVVKNINSMFSHIPTKELVLD